MSTRSPVVNVFAREGEYWTVVFDGRVSRLRDAKGLHYLDHLLRHPGRELHALALVAAVDAPAPDRRSSGGRAVGLEVAGAGDAGQVLDGTAIAAYRRRFDELRDELAEAEAFGDGERAARAREELDALAEQLTAGVGLGGRARRAGSAAERARLAVTKAIRSALRKISEADSALANHLDGAVRTGTFCVYRPDPGLALEWRHEVSPDRPTGPGRAPVAWTGFRPPAARTTYVGRPVERRLADELVAAAAAGRGGLVLVSGEAGIGKTRFTEEAAGEAQGRGMATLLGRCLEAERAVPWLPLVEVLEQLAAHLPDDELRTLLGDAGPEVAKVVPSLRRRFATLPPALELPAEQARHFLYTSLRDLLLRVAAGRALVLVLEDLHWADAATLTLLEHLVDRLETARLLVLATYRSDEAVVGTPLAHTLERLVRHAACSRVTLRPLDVAEVGELVAALSGRIPPPAVATRLRADTDGNPFFVEELCKHLADAGRLFGADGEIRAELADEEVGLPESLRFLLGHRLQRLSPQCRQVVNGAAVIGRDVDVDLLAGIGSDDQDSLVDAVDEAVAAGVLVDAPAGLGATIASSAAAPPGPAGPAIASSAAAPPGPAGPGAGDRLTFSHALVRQAALAELSTIRRRRLHLDVATALQRRHGEDPERAAEIADHLQQAGAGADPATTATYLHLAGQRSLDAAAYEDAVARLRGALELLAPGDHARRAEILADLGYAERGMARLEDAVRSWTDALALLEDTAEVDVALVAKLCRALGRSLDNTGRLDEAVSVVRRGLRMVGASSSAERSALLSALAYTLALRGDHTEAEARLDEAAVIADALEDGRLRADVHLTRNALLFTAGRLAECVDTADAAAAALRSCGQAWDAPQAQVTVLWPCVWLGRVTEARRRVAECEPQARRLGHVPATFLTRRTAALLDLMASGDLEPFRRNATDGVEFCRANRLRWLPDAHVFAGLAEFWLGDWDEAAEHLRAAASAPAPPVYAGRYSATLLTFHAWNDDVQAFDRLAAEIRASVARLGLDRSVGVLAATLAEVEGLVLLGRDAEAAARYPVVTAMMADGLVLRPPDLRVVAALAGATAGLAGDRTASEAHFAEARRLVEKLPHPRERPDVDFLEAVSLTAGPGRPAGADRAWRLLANAVDGYRALGMKRHAAVAERRR